MVASVTMINKSFQKLSYIFSQLFDIKYSVKITLSPHVWNRNRQIDISSRRRGVKGKEKVLVV